jgi:hypothetical protein
VQIKREIAAPPHQISVKGAEGSKSVLSPLTWASAVPSEDLSSYFSGNINTISDDQNDQPPEARAWSSVLNTNSDN